MEHARGVLPQGQRPGRPLLLLPRGDPTGIEAGLSMPDQPLQLVQRELGRLSGQHLLHGLDLHGVRPGAHPVQHPHDHLRGIHADGPGVQRRRHMRVGRRQHLTAQRAPRRGALTHLDQLHRAPDLSAPGRGNQPTRRREPLRAGQVPLPATHGRPLGDLRGQHRPERLGPPGQRPHRPDNGQQPRIRELTDLHRGVAIDSPEGRQRPRPRLTHRGGRRLQSQHW